MTETDLPDDPRLTTAAVLLDALGVAWSTHQLYPNPEEQAAFLRVMANLHEVVTESPALSISTSGFSLDGVPINTTREGASRLAKQLFLHDIESLQLTATPSNQELTAFFSVLATEESEVRRAGGCRAAFGAAGIVNIVTRQRRLLQDAEEETFERDPIVSQVVAESDDPEAFARRLLLEAENDPERLSKLFHSKYRDVYDAVNERDYRAREDVVKTFVEAFAYFPDAFKTSVVSEYIAGKDDPIDQVFLDQFPGHELAQLAPHLDPNSFLLLIEYARVSVDAADSRPEELLPLLQPAAEVTQAREAVIGRVGHLLREFNEASAPESETVQRLLQEMQGIPEPFDVGIATIRGLMECERRPHRFKRVARIWTSRAARYIKDGDLIKAAAWLESVRQDPQYSPEFQPDLDRALTKMATPDVLDAMIAGVGEGSEDAAHAILKTWGEPVFDQLVELLADEEDAGRRRGMIDLLGVLARNNPRPIAKHLGDGRWYVLRNLATVLARSGQARSIPQLKRLFRHEDHRVRVEALRGLASVGGGQRVSLLLDALQDENERVRSTALALLRTTDLSEDLAHVVEAIEDDSVALPDTTALINMLADQEDVRVVETLKGLATRKAFLRPGAKAVREAARAALERRGT